MTTQKPHASQASTCRQPENTHAQPQQAAMWQHEPVPSEQLLCGCKVLKISHKGAIYRLQVTRQGKLILTK